MIAGSKEDVVIKQGLLISLAAASMAATQPTTTPKFMPNAAGRVLSPYTVHPHNSGTTLCDHRYSRDPLLCRFTESGKMRFVIGQTVPAQTLTDYKSVPFETRIEYGKKLSKSNRYLIDANYAYGVDPETLTVVQIARLVTASY